MPESKKNQTLDLVGQEIRNKLKEIGKIWKNSNHNQKISEDILKKWKDLIDAWAEDRTLPLIIRKETSRKGKVTFILQEEKLFMQIIPLQYGFIGMH